MYSTLTSPAEIIAEPQDLINLLLSAAVGVGAAIDQVAVMASFGGEPLVVADLDEAVDILAGVRGTLLHTVEVLSAQQERRACSR